MQSQKQKKNHWVPQGYLRWFAADSPRRKRTWVTDKNNKDAELKLIEKVAVRYHLYTPMGSDGKRDYRSEERLSELEQFFGKGELWDEVAEGTVNLQDETMRKAISLLAAVMFMRSPLRFETYRAIHEKIVGLYSKDGRLPQEGDVFLINGRKYTVQDKSDWESYRTADNEQKKGGWIKIIQSVSWLAEIIINMRWTMFTYDDPCFITSDNPAFLLHSSKKHPGFGTPGVTATFPVSPRRVLTFDRDKGADGCYRRVTETLNI